MSMAILKQVVLDTVLLESLIDLDTNCERVQDY
jgi:hypothetical protein